MCGEQCYARRWTNASDTMTAATGGLMYGAENKRQGRAKNCSGGQLSTGRQLHHYS